MRKNTLACLLVLMIIIQFVPVYTRAVSPPPIIEFNGRPLTFETPPINEGGRIFVPMRIIFEAFGASVQWNAQTRTITVKHGSIDITMTANSRMVNNDGETIEIDHPPRIISGRTFVPLRFVSQALGGTVNWLHNSNRVTIFPHPFGSFEYMRNRIDQNFIPFIHRTPEYYELMKTENNVSYLHMAQWLKKNVTNEYLRFNGIVSWVRSNIRFPSMGVYVEDLSEWENRHTPEAVFSSKEALPEGFANLFKAMATEAGLEAAVVSGLKRHTHRERPPGSTLPLDRHYWNAVKINEHWYLVDLSQVSQTLVHAVSNILERTRIFQGGLRGLGIAITPSQLIRMHFPDDPRWQLLETPLTFEQFLAQPTVSPAFVSYGIELLSHQGGTIEVAAADMPNFFILVRENDRFIYDMGMKEYKYPEYRSFLRAEGNRLFRMSRSEGIGNQTYRLFSSIREPGTYVLQLLGINRWRQDQSTVVEYKLIVR